MTVYACVAVCDPFVTFTVKLYVFAAVGVPEMTPVKAPIASPVGRAPDEMLHVNGPVALPVVVSVCEYATFTVPVGRVAGRMPRVTFTVRVPMVCGPHDQLLSDVPLFVPVM